LPTASEIAKEQIKVTPQRKHELDTMRQMVDEAEDIVSNPNRSLDEFGRLLHESWQIKRTLTQNITNTSLDEIYEAGRRAGALGGKLLGAGGGGFMLFFVAPERRKNCACASESAVCTCAFSNRGSHVGYEPDEVYDKSLTMERSEVYARNHPPMRTSTANRNAEEAGMQPSARFPYVLIAPALIEEAFIEDDHSVVHQTHLPVKWVIVDDSSADSTPAASGLCVEIPLAPNW
jgi:hypothetical protein